MPLKKSLGTLDVFSIAAGAMISSGLFILPAVVYKTAGPGIILSYGLAAILIIPSLFSKAELATAMPKAGGTYFFIHKSLGSLTGTIAGFTGWISLVLKSSFALMGIGIFLTSVTDVPFITVKTTAVIFALFFGILNSLSVKHTGALQSILVFLLITILGLYIIFGMGKISVHNFLPFIPNGRMSVISVSGAIFISFGGLTKIADISEEVKNPGKTIPAGMFSAFFIVTILYILTVFVTVGLLTPDLFNRTLTPISTGAQTIFGSPGLIFLEAAALMAFITTGNGGLLAASRTPLAMARDSLLPKYFAKINGKTKTPIISIASTTLLMALFIILLDLEHLIKVASTIMLFLFTLDNLSVILMRESKITSYRPAFKSPLYPWIQIIGVVSYMLIMLKMGSFVLLTTAVFVFASILWYILFTGIKQKKDSALIHIVKRITAKELQSDTLSEELKTILIERDSIVQDRFDKIISQAKIFDLEEDISRKELFLLLADEISAKFSTGSKTVFDLLESREKISTTVIHPGLAIPHIVIGEGNEFEIVVVRSKKGIVFTEGLPLVHTVFALAGSSRERNFHLQALMAIAQIVQNPFFKSQWLKARGKEDLKNIILLTERSRKGTTHDDTSKD